MIYERTGKTWTVEEESYLQDKWGCVSIDSMSFHLQRSPAAISQRAQKMGLGPFLESGEYINKHQLFLALGIGESGSYTKTSWGENRNFPFRKIRRKNKSFDVVYVDEFWEWAEKNQAFLDFSNFEKYNLGPEPEWVDKKRTQDIRRARQFKIKKTPWTRNEDERLLHYLREHKYSYSDLSRMLNRTNGAIQRRICDLGLKERPIKADNTIKWSEEEYDILAEMIKEGSYSYEAISEKIGKSVKAIRGRVFNEYLTERLDKVREYIGTGEWGDGRPSFPLRYRRLMPQEKKEEADGLLSVLAGQLLELAREKSDVCEEFKDYFQKDMCANWDEIKGCTVNESSCDYCGQFRRISPQYCVRCGGTFYERAENKICKSCREARIRQAQRKYAVLNRRKEDGK